MNGWGRWRGSMDPMACKYPQGSDGIVYAEFDMLLQPDGLWYRDRSIRTRDGSIRGEIDGFSWLLFDRRSALKPLRRAGFRSRGSPPAHWRRC